MDEGIRTVVSALKSAGMYENSVIVFSTDNGGATDASNYPLRGAKEQLYDGGVRGISFLHSPFLKRSGSHNG